MPSLDSSHKQQFPPENLRLQRAWILDWTAPGHDLAGAPMGTHGRRTDGNTPNPAWASRLQVTLEADHAADARLSSGCLMVQRHSMQAEAQHASTGTACKQKHSSTHPGRLHVGPTVPRGLGPIGQAVRCHQQGVCTACAKMRGGTIGCHQPRCVGRLWVALVQPRPLKSMLPRLYCPWGEPNCAALQAMAQHQLWPQRGGHVKQREHACTDDAA